MTKLKIGDGLQLPLEIAGQAVALVGIRGSGKTNTAGVIAEELLDRGQQIVVLDPTDAWWGLRSEYPVFIFGGPHGDLPLTEADGKTLAEFVAQEKVPVILSLRHLRKGAQRRLVMEFCEELYHLKGQPAYREPLTVFIDEAPQFVPQRVMGEMARLVGAVQDMILLGRSAGFGVVMISQRFATLNADVRTQADTVIVHRLPSPLDRKALTEWIEENATIAEQKDVLSSLAQLKTGEAWIWSPYFELFKRAQIRARRTFDSSAAPKQGAPARTPKDLTKVDIDKLKGKLASAIEKAKADDPKELRRRIVELEKQVAKPAPQPNPKKEAIRQPVLTDADRVLIEKVGAQIQEVGRVLASNATYDLEDLTKTIASDLARFKADALAEIEDRRKDFVGILDKKGFQKVLDKLATLPVPDPRQPAGTRAAPATTGRSSAVTRPAETRAPRVPGGPGVAGSVKLKKGAREILTALASRSPSPLQWSQLALLCGIKATGSTMSSYMSNLRSAGFIAESGESVSITDPGVRYFGDGAIPSVQSKDEILSTWAGRLKKGARAILDDLDSCYPKWRTRSDLADRVLGIEAAGSTLSSYLSNLRTAGLIQERGDEVRLHEDLFS